MFKIVLFLFRIFIVVFDRGLLFWFVIVFEIEIGLGCNEIFVVVWVFGKIVVLSIFCVKFVELVVII